MWTVVEATAGAGRGGREVSQAGGMAGRRHRATLTDLSCKREPRANSHSNAGKFYNPRLFTACC